MNSGKKLILLSFLCSLLLACNGENPSEPDESEETTDVLAFPHAEGAGCYVTGGRGGSVVFVTSLEDDQNMAGTLRYALNLPGTKTIVFRVAGVINLAKELRIKVGNVTIAGQSAPGDGICIKGYPVFIETDNVIIRFLRFRMGDENKVEQDALTCVGHKNIIIDHCSMSWSTDECVSCYGNTDFTLQYCIISESLRNSVHLKGAHGYGGIWGGKNVTFHHNLLAHHDSRNPRFDHDYVSLVKGPLDYVNNVVYNWGGNSAYGGESKADEAENRDINMQNNYYKGGSATRYANRLLNPTVSCSNCESEDPASVKPMRVYLTGNYVYGDATVTADNWNGGVQGVSAEVLAAIKSDTRFGVTPATVLQTAEEAYETVLSKAGASYVRDVVDARVVNEVRNGNYTYTGSNGSTNGLIDSQTDVGGWPDYCYTAADVPADSDNDGIPDEWEDANGLNKSSASDGKTKTLNANYTNIEVYLNSLVEDLY